MGIPTVPTLFFLGTFDAITGAVSVNPWPSKTGKFMDQKNSERSGASGAPPEKKYRILPPRPARIFEYTMRSAICQRCFVHTEGALPYARHGIDSCATRKDQSKIFLFKPVSLRPLSTMLAYIFSKKRGTAAAYVGFSSRNPCGTASICSTYAIGTPRNK